MVQPRRTIKKMIRKSGSRRTSAWQNAVPHNGIAISRQKFYNFCRNREHSHAPRKLVALRQRAHSKVVLRGIRPAGFQGL